MQLRTVVENVQQKIGENESEVHLAVLPCKFSLANKICIELNRRGIILYIKREPLEFSWVFVERETLLKKVNGTIFAPKGFQEYKSLAIHTGVVPFKKICDHLRLMEETKHMDIELLLQFMIHMEVCREITDSNMLDLLAINYPNYKDDHHFLFPGLITESIEGVQNVTSASELWQPAPGITYSAHSSCWVLECHGIQHYFSSHFREVLLLHLAFKHALPAHPHNESAAILGFKQACRLWRNGIWWTSTSFIEVLVSIEDHKVTVLLRCRESKEEELAYTRSQVIADVIAAKEEFCSNTEISESFIPNATFPLNTDISVPLVNVMHSIAHHKEGVITSDNTTIELHCLVYFEPYMYFSKECLFDLYSHHSQPCTHTNVTLY